MYPRNWTEMTPAERRAWRIDRWRNPDIEWASPEAEAEYKARVDRIVAAVELRKPDRVPIYLDTGYWPAAHAGMTVYEAMHDVERAHRAWVDFNVEFQPDLMAPPNSYVVPADMFELLDYRLYSWPGHGVVHHASYQYNEREWMLAEEYDHLISDPSDFMLRAYLPRTVGAFGGFADVSSLFDFVELPFVTGHVAGWGSDDMISSLERLTEAARVARHWGGVVGSLNVQLMSLGWPVYWAGVSKAPFDILGDSLRGFRGLIFDLFRRPDKVLAACERLVPIAIDWTLRRSAEMAGPVVALPLHKGADGFMSLEQFEHFYWPGLRAVIMGLVDQGCIPLLFAEGRYDSRLEVISDLPKGATIWLFDQTDMGHAKETIGKVACLEGNMPLSLLHTSTPEAVAKHTKHLIDVAGSDGGFILDFGAVADNGNSENLHTMMDTAKSYGVY